jgi:SAM-dependent methyltransferase
MTEEDFKNLAQQLSCPEGENGIRTGENMNLTNSNMIHSTLDAMNIGADEQILEIGPGNGSHLESIIKKNTDVHYTGIDISETMILEARRINKNFIDTCFADFKLTNGKILDLECGTYDKIFTVNTLYFWEEPLNYAKEILRVLKPGGEFYLAFAEKDFMKTLPFTVYGFQLYDINDAERLISDAGFAIEDVKTKTEDIKSNTGEAVKRNFIILRSSKPLS